MVIIDYPFSLSCFKNAHANLRKEYTKINEKFKSNDTYIDAIGQLWKDKHNIMLTYISGDHMPYWSASFDTESDFTHFVLKWG